MARAPRDIRKGSKPKRYNSLADVISTIMSGRLPRSARTTAISAGDPTGGADNRLRGPNADAVREFL